MLGERFPVGDGSVAGSEMSSRRVYVAWGLVTFTFATLLQVASLFLAHGGDPGSMLRLPKSAGGSQEAGFDGQFSLALAEDPLLASSAEARLDAPGLRARRIAVPFVAHLLAPVLGGHAVALLALQTIGFGLLVLIVQVPARAQGLPAVLCAAIGMSLPFVLSIELVTVELAASVWILVAAHGAARGRHFGAACALAAACLTKEVALVAVAAFVLAPLARRRWREAIIIATAAIPLALWEAFLSFRLAQPSGSAGLLQNLSFPGLGILKAFLTHGELIAFGPTRIKALGLFLALLWYLFGSVLAVSLGRGPWTPGRTMGVFGAILMVALSFGGDAQAYNEVFNFGRQLFPVVVGLAMVLVFEGRSLSSGTRAALMWWFVAGTGLGLGWWAQEIAKRWLGI